ncbi:unnamed protein product [Absidia cylindrospora]
MDPEYNPSHKTSSITSTTSTNSWDTVPSLTASSICDVDSPSLHDQPTFDDCPFVGDQLGFVMPFEDFATPNDNDVLNDTDQKSFNQFLDNFFTDGRPPAALTGKGKQPTGPSNEGAPIFLHQSHEITIPHTASMNKETPPKPLLSSHHQHEPKLERLDETTTDDDHKQEDDASAETNADYQQQRPCRDLLTEDEKRANHIASEQKRRNTIRTGFKEMTEIIPTLKNINNSKSTILFKAVEYIRHLDKRNRGLRDKLSSLQVRLEVEGRMGGFMRGPHHLLRRHSHYYNEHQHKRSRSNSQSQGQQLPPEAVAALLAHKNQQKQLELLQEQLRYQQELLAKHNISTAHMNSPRSTNNRHLSMDERAPPPSSPSSNMYYSISIPTDHPLSTTASHQSSLSSSSSQRHPSVHNHQFPPSQHAHPHQRSSAPALVMPNMLDDHWHSTSADASPLGVASFNIPADEEYGRNLSSTSKLRS